MGMIHLRFILATAMALSPMLTVLRAEAKPLQIVVKTLDGQKRPLAVDSGDTPRNLKERLAEKTGIYKELIRLIYEGTPLKDDATLDSQNVKDGSVIHMITQLRGG